MELQLVVTMLRFRVLAFVGAMNSVFLGAQQDTLLLPAPVADSIQIQIKQQQRMEHLNLVIDTLSSGKQCSSLLNATTQEQEYCRSRFSSIHPEEE